MSLQSASAHGQCSLTSSMLQEAVEELEKRRARVPLDLLSKHLRSRYPVTKDVDRFKNELQLVTDKAVKSGWLKKFSDDTVCLATFRWEATAKEFGFD